MGLLDHVLGRHRRGRRRLAGYLTVFIPALADNPVGQALSALALIWTLTLINIRGLKESSIVQIALTLLKLAPLVAIIALGVFAGRPENLPALVAYGARQVRLSAPRAAASGAPFVIVVADASGAIAEGEEGGNIVWERVAP